MGCSCQLQVELKPEFQAQAEAVFRDADLEPEDGLIEKTAALITYNFEQIHSSAPDDIRSDLVNAGVQCKVTTHYSDTEYAPELSLLEPQEENGPIVEVTMNEIEAAANAERTLLLKMIEDGADVSSLQNHLQKNTNQRFALFHQP